MKNKERAFLLLLILVISVSVNLCLASNSLFDLSALLLAVSSLAISLINLKSYLDPAQQNVWNAANESAREAQRMIQEKPFGIFKYASWKQVYGYDDIPAGSIQEVIKTPLIWLLCITLYAMFFFTPAYFEFSFDDPRKVLKLIFFSFLQTLFLSTAFLGMLLTINRK